MAGMKLPRFQFRLRTLFVAVAIVAVQCAACLPMLREWQKQKEWKDADGTGSIAPFETKIVCYFDRLVRRHDGRMVRRIHHVPVDHGPVRTAGTSIAADVR
jgi:hypothetical protein